MRRFVSLPLSGILLSTLCACTGGVRGGRAPAALAPEQGSVVGTPAPAMGGPSTERMVTVPTLVGLDLESAARLAHGAGLELMALRVPGTPEGTVLEQNPAAGRQVPEGAPVRVRIASGTVSGPDSSTSPAVEPEVPVVATPEVPSPPAPPAALDPTEPLPVPSVLDRTEPVARRILSDAGFRVRIEATESGVKGRVMDQLPSAGDRLPRGSEIVLKVPGYVPSAEALLGSPDAAPEGIEPSAPPIATEATEPQAAIPTPPPAPPAPSLDVPPEVVVPETVVPEAPPSVDVEPPADEVPAPIFAGPRSLAGTPPPVAPPVPEAPAPPADAVPTPPSDVVPVPVPPADAVPTPPSDAVPVPVPPADAVPVPPGDAVPAPPPAPPTPPTETAGEPAGPSLPGLAIPKPKSPPHDSQIPIAPSVSMELSWEPVTGATGYLIELEELVGDAWTPLERRIVKAPKALAQIEPSQQTATDVRWRVRSVVGRRGGRPAPWVVVHLR